MSESPRRDERVLVVDDDEEFARTIAEGLEGRGWTVLPVQGPQRALEIVRARECDAMVTDLRMPGMDGLQLLRAARTHAADLPIIIMTAFSAIDSAVECVRQGAFHYLTKPFKLTELDIYLQRAMENRRLRKTAHELRQELNDRCGMGALIGKSPAMKDVFDLIRRVANASVPVLITGETGTGKTMIARAMHAESERASAPFVSVNCAAIPETLLESELFGHVRGAFTGATSTRAGLIVEANGGTLLLDEIGDMNPSLQAKLLHVLENGNVRPIGASRERETDVRVVAATHRDLRELVAVGKFREDLLYRLQGVVIEIPALRERREDIPGLAEHFLAEARARTPQSDVQRLSSSALQVMIEYGWPGNVRELEHAINRAVLLGRGPDAEAKDLPGLVERKVASSECYFGDTVMPVRDMQRRYAAWALDKLGGRKMLTCEKLGIDSKTLAKWLSIEQE